MQTTLEVELDVWFSSTAVSCWPDSPWDDSLTTLLLRLAGPSGARFECLPCDVVGKPLRWGPLAEGRWTAEGVLIDAAGETRAVAPVVRFRAGDSDETRIHLRFHTASPRSS